MVDGEEPTEQISDDCEVYRIVYYPDDIKEDGQPKSSAFANSSPREGESLEDCYMSVFLEDEMSAAGTTPEQLLKWWGKPARLFKFTVSQLKSYGEEVFRAPIDEFPGHGGVRRSDRSRRSGGQKKKLAREAKYHDVPGDSTGND